MGELAGDTKQRFMLKLPEARRDSDMLGLNRVLSAKGRGREVTHSVSERTNNKGSR